METATITEILDDNAKSGKSEKTQKVWSMSRVGLSNGESAFIFNPIEIGDVVEKVKNGEYENWQKKKVDPKHDEIMKILKLILIKLETQDKALRAIYKAITTGEPQLPTPPPKPVEKPLDTVHEVVDGEPVNLDDIPF